MRRPRLSRPRRQPALIARALVLLALLATAPGFAFAQSTSVLAPENSHAKSYGSGWQCDQGYRESDGACAAIKVPVNAYLTNVSYGRGWECDYGHLLVIGACEPVKVPSNAFLNPSGKRWECNRGYRTVDEACVAIKVPANGYLAGSLHGSGWACDRGYRAVGEACIAIKVWLGVRKSIAIFQSG